MRKLLPPKTDRNKKMNLSLGLKLFRNLLLSLLTLGLVVGMIIYQPEPIAALQQRSGFDGESNRIVTAMTNRTPINNMDTTEYQAIALTLVNQLIQGNFEEAFANFSPATQRNVTVEEIQQAWTAITQELGDFQEIKEVNRQILGGREVFVVVCQFAKDSLRVQVMVNSDRQIAGLYFIPVQATQTFAPPSYADPSKFREETVQIGTGANPLPGTLTVPREGSNFPVVVLVHGSGPNDRDETIGANKPFRDLAWGLASLGVAVLRYDKRTLVYPQEFQGSFTIKEEVVDDAIEAVNFLRQYAQTNQNLASLNPQSIYVLGHSLGGLIIPRIGARDSQLAGLIALAAPTRPLEDLFLEQTIYLVNLDGTVTPEEQQLIDGIRQQAEVIKNAAWDRVPANTLLLGATVSYWQDLQGYDPAIVAQSLTQRLLILQGERDYQVTMADFQGWQTALGDRPNATLKSYPQLNHLFIPGTGTPSPAEYQVSSHVSETVIQDITDWIKRPSP